MSIEKHLARAAHEQGRIHDLTIESRERPKVYFDPTRDLTEKDFSLMRDCFTKHRSAVARVAARSMANYDHRQERMSRVLFAAHAAELHFLDRTTELKNLEWVSLRRVLEYSQANAEWSSILSLAASMKRMRPSYEVPLTPKTRKGIVEHIERIKQRLQWAHFIYEAARFRIIDPTFHIQATNEEWRAMQGAIEELFQSRRLKDFAETSTLFRLLHPPNNLPMSPEGVDFIKQELEKARREDDGDAIRHCAYALSIVTPENVEVTQEGLQITQYAENFDTKRVLRPERKVT